MDGVAGGACIWFTGRSGAGKSTVMRALVPLLEAAGRSVTVLDTVPELAKRWCEWSSRAKLLRKAYVAREVVRHGGIAVCVTVSARAAVRKAVRSKVGPDHFIEVFVDVPPEVSATRRAGRRKKPAPLKRAKWLLRAAASRLRREDRAAFEVPEAPDVRIDATAQPPDAAARVIVAELIARGLLSLPEGGGVEFRAVRENAR